MYARLVRFSFAPGQHDAAQAIADDLAPLIAGQPGCGGVWVFGDPPAGSGQAGDGECGIFVLWDSEEHANAAAQMIRPKLDEHLSGKIKGPPDARLFRVLST